MTCANDCRYEVNEVNERWQMELGLDEMGKQWMRNWEWLEDKEDLGLGIKDQYGTCHWYWIHHCNERKIGKIKMKKKMGWKG